MSKSNATETDLLNLIFLKTALPWDAVTQLDVHLHTADPGEAGVSTTNECNYTGYAVAVTERNATDWTVTGNQVVNDILVQFPTCTAGTNTATHGSITPHGSTQIIYSGLLNDPLNISNGIQPQFNPGDLAFEED